MRPTERTTDDRPNAFELSESNTAPVATPTHTSDTSGQTTDGYDTVVQDDDTFIADDGYESISTRRPITNGIVMHNYARHSSVYSF